MRCKAWHQQGVVVIKPEDVVSWEDRQLLVNLATQMYGARA